MNDPGAGGPLGTGATTTEVLEGLNDLLQLDHDAVGAYEVAIEQLEDREDALQIEGFKHDHERHIRDLNDVIQQLGGTPANEPHATAPLKQAIQKIAGVGGDRALLLAWRANELQTTTKYDRYAQKALTWPPAAKRVVDQNALDEERHYQWVVERLSAGDGGEVHLANRMRENLTRARIATDDLRVTLAQEIGTNPGRSLLACFALGFVLGRVLR